ncbi:hypothetical protein SAMD00019534_014510 [Acytostelium subglobosum LB1]|uniref:hypothetical protein n=1 Tax=Acytostelium subglobosum LB1 TaxID=1410327 RepID=UPI000644A63E|nr:hypothetical protein SAMD00019534_014510 [Acytostelium subglobosum LB1]GAM18276.1 hypothetical protein SAMD00019534_014510 [Acytostelium subglobosum LB1]|eukprot:XP_012758872.1 hypothetical protein SAMD00019534_014510 [Acytostelium subglobosum LB1]
MPTILTLFLSIIYSTTGRSTIVYVTFVRYCSTTTIDCSSTKSAIVVNIAHVCCSTTNIDCSSTSSAIVVNIAYVCCSTTTTTIDCNTQV